MKSQTSSFSRQLIWIKGFFSIKKVSHLTAISTQWISFEIATIIDSFPLTIPIGSTLQLNEYDDEYEPSFLVLSPHFSILLSPLPNQNFDEKKCEVIISERLTMMLDSAKWKSLYLAGYIMALFLDLSLKVTSRS